jgi:hypothetical protein
VAAYRLDRALGLNMVPVAVVRHVKVEGAVIEWIQDAFSERERREKNLEPPDSERLVQQQALMHLLDALMLNKTRSETDQLIELDSWHLRLIDHSRAFRESTEMLPSFADRPACLPRSVLSKLEELDGESLNELMAELLSATQIRALLERRDKVLEKISADRERLGDSKVFQD